MLLACNKNLNQSCRPVFRTCVTPPASGGMNRCGRDLRISSLPRRSHEIAEDGGLDRRCSSAVVMKQCSRLSVLTAGRGARPRSLVSIYPSPRAQQTTILPNDLDQSVTTQAAMRFFRAVARRRYGTMLGVQDALSPQYITRYGEPPRLNEGQVLLSPSAPAFAHISAVDAPAEHHVGVRGTPQRRQARDCCKASISMVTPLSSRQEPP